MTQKPSYKPAYKRPPNRRKDIALYLGAVAFLIGYLFGTGFFSFSVG